MAAHDAGDTFDRESWNKAAAFGIHGLPIPAEYGGQGRDLLSTILAMEALGRGSRDNGLVFSINAQMWACEMPILKQWRQQKLWARHQFNDYSGSGFGLMRR